MAKRGISIEKASKEDIFATLDFLRTMDTLFDNQLFSSSETSWENWDDDDKDKQTLLSIRAEIASSERCDEDEVDNDLILFQFIRMKFKQCECSWGRVLTAADSLIDACCDPNQDILAYHPYISRSIDNSLLGE